MRSKERGWERGKIGPFEIGLVIFKIKGGMA
jgi:hypothetical protein